MGEGYSPKRVSLFPFLLTLVLSLLIAAPLASPAAAQDAAPLVVASGPLSEPILAVEARADRSADTLRLYGYVTRASGLTSAELFSGDAASVATARFTFTADMSQDAPVNRADTTSYTGTGTLRVYLAPDGGADWANPATFGAGEAVAAYDLNLAETLQRQSPQVGVLVGVGDLTQTEAGEFSLDGADYRFGAANLGARLRYTGALLPAPAEGFAQSAIVFGQTNVTRRDVQVVQMGLPAATPAPGDTSGAVSACAFAPWLDNATAAATLAGAGVGALDLSALDAVNQEAVQTLATRLDESIAGLRAGDVPADATDANRLLITALSTTSRGLRGVDAAVAAGDATSFSQATGVLTDANALLAQAQTAIAPLAAACPAP
ncbi:MAG: hypothetical protein QM692_22150 [Thermomicrobiales bacterium]